MAELIIHVAKDYLATVREVSISANRDNPFFVCDIDDIIEKYNKWINCMPRIKPFYAVKCNHHPTVLKIIAALGLGFDCASKAELSKVLSIDGVDTSRIIYAHPIKPPGHISYAASKNVSLTTFDNKCELYKLKKLFPGCKAVLRIKYDASESQRPLGLKFGCDPKTEAPQLLQLALKLGINVVGVSFHVGVGCRTPCTYYKAIASARNVFDIASDLGINLKLLDIGGGFPGPADDTILEFATYINAAIDTFFPDPSIEIISEPGTYFVLSAFVSVCNIHGVKKIDAKDKPPEYMYYVNDGIYGTFTHAVVFKLTKIPLLLKERSGEEEFVTTIWGPTCDSFDKVVSNILLPKLELGEWLVFQECGAYTIPLATSFNGFGTPEVYCSINQRNGSWLSKQKLFLKDTFVLHSTFAVKCNDHPTVLKVIAALGLGFDCASKAELTKVLSIDGVDTSRIIYAHTIKPPGHISYAASKNVSLTTFDNKCELYKLKKLFPGCKAVLRIKYDAPESQRALGLKFGCNPKTEATQLLQLALKLGINVVGVSFHVGVGCRTPCTYYNAIASARNVFDITGKLGIHLKLLDIGGGFPGTADDAILEYSTYINAAIQNFFPDPSIEIISEPGTYFVLSSFLSVCNIHGVKKIDVKDKPPEYMYYVNDGIYGTFTHAVIFNLTKIPLPLQKRCGEEDFISTIWGPTCDSFDKIVSNILLPKLELGEWLVFQECGAYTLPLATRFNGFSMPEVYFSINQRNGAWLSKHLFLKNTFVLPSTFSH